MPLNTPVGQEAPDTKRLVTSLCHLTRIQMFTVATMNSTRGSQRPQKEAQAWALRLVTGSSPLSETLRPQLSEGPGPTDHG